VAQLCQMVHCQFCSLEVVIIHSAVAIASCEAISIHYWNWQLGQDASHIAGVQANINDAADPSGEKVGHAVLHRAEKLWPADHLFIVGRPLGGI